MLNRDCGIRIAGVWEKHTLGGVGAGDHERGAPLLSSPNCLNVLLPLEVASGRGAFLSAHGICGNLQLQEPSRSKVYSQPKGAQPMAIKVS